MFTESTNKIMPFKNEMISISWFNYVQYDEKQKSISFKLSFSVVINLFLLIMKKFRWKMMRNFLVLFKKMLFKIEIFPAWKAGFSLVLQ
jgi:hypothetical protein